MADLERNMKIKVETGAAQEAVGKLAELAAMERATCAAVAVESRRSCQSARAKSKSKAPSERRRQESGARRAGAGAPEDIACLTDADLERARRVQLRDARRAAGVPAR